MLGPVVTDESDPLFMGADGHSNNTGPGELQAVAEALLWLKDTERSLSPVLFCLDSEYAAKCRATCEYDDTRTRSCLSLYLHTRRSLIACE